VALLAPVGALAVSQPASAAKGPTVSCSDLSINEIESVLGYKVPPVVAIKPPSVAGVPSLTGTLTCNWGVMGATGWANLVFQSTTSASWKSDYSAVANTIVKNLGFPAYAFPVYSKKGSDTLLYADVNGEVVSLGAPAPLAKVETLAMKAIAAYRA
jgi:hypothetical protein